jgi:hypothetical protein
MTDTTLLQRFGNVLYWLGCAVAALFLAATLFVVAIVLGAFGGTTAPSETLLFAGYPLGLALASWVVGRAARYLFAGI